MSIPFAPAAGVPNVGTNVLMGVQSFGLQNVPQFGASWLPGVTGDTVASAYRAMAGGLDFEDNTTTNFQSNQGVHKSYTAMPWNDNTEQMIQEGMCIFASRHCDRGGLTNMVPVFKLNMLLQERHNTFQQRFANGMVDETDFQTFLDAHGDNVLFTYHRLLQTNRASAAKMANNYANIEKAYKLSKEEKCAYASAFGILQRWNFLGICISKQDSTGEDNYVEVSVNKQTMSSIGLSTGLRAKAFNIWPDSAGTMRVNSKLFFILRRKDGEAGKAFQFECCSCFNRDYPQSGDVCYVTKKTADAPTYDFGIVIPVGTVTETTSYRADKERQIVATGEAAVTLYDAQNATAALPEIIIQLRI